MCGHPTRFSLAQHSIVPAESMSGKSRSSSGRLYGFLFRDATRMQAGKSMPCQKSTCTMITSRKHSAGFVKQVLLSLIANLAMQSCIYHRCLSRHEGLQATAIEHTICLHHSGRTSPYSDNEKSRSKQSYQQSDSHSSPSKAGAQQSCQSLCVG